MTTRRIKKRNYTDEDRRKVVVLYLTLGNFTAVAKQTGFPVRTITDWRHNADWWDEFAAGVDQEKTDRIKANIDKIIDSALKNTLDRLKNGDEVVDKNGNKIRRKMSGRDTAIVGAVYFDKRQVLSHQPTSINSTNVDSRLAEYMAKFEELGRALSAKVIEGEIVENEAAANCLTADGGDG